MTNTNALSSFTCHCELKRGNLVLKGLLRHFVPRNDYLLNVSVIVPTTEGSLRFWKSFHAREGLPGKLLGV